MRLYVERETQLGDSTLVHPVTARSAHLIEFEFAGPIEIQPIEGGVSRTALTAALVGLQTSQRNQLLVRSHVHSFVIFLQPAAVHRLFGLPAVEIVNSEQPFHAVLGAAGSQLHQRLGDAQSFEKRVQIAEQFILNQSAGARSNRAIESAASQIMQDQGGCRIDNLADYAGLSTRNFQRAFHDHVGVAPKLFARIVRFESALKAKALSPQKSWTSVAHEFGYYDHTHMILDFRQLAGESPTGILGQFEGVFAPQIASSEETNPEMLTI